MRHFTLYVDDLAEPKAAVHVTIEFRTWAGSPAVWSRWTEGPDLTAALDAAKAHVRGFKRCMRLDGGSAAPRLSKAVGAA